MSILASVLHLLLLGGLAALPQRKLVHPRRNTRLALGLLWGLASALLACQGALIALPEHGQVHPGFLASATFLWGAGPGALAAGVALVGALLAGGSVSWLLGGVLAASSVALGLGWRLAHHRLHLSIWLAIGGLALSLPVPLAIATDTLLPPAGPSPLSWSIQDTAWRYGFSVALLCAVAAVFRSRAHSLLLLHQRELDLAGALRASGAGRWEWDVGLGRWSYGGRLYRDFGLRDSPEDGAGALAHVLLPSRRWRRWARSRLHRGDMRRLRPYLRRVLQGREHTVQVELRMRDDQGRWRWLILRGHAVSTDARGRALRLAGMQLDITGERQMLEALRASEERYTTVYQTLPDAAGITTLADGRYLDVNPAFERLFSLPREQIVGRTSLELGIWRDQAERERLLDALEHHGEARGLPMTAYRGEQRVPGLMSARTTHLGGEAHVIFVFHDLSQEQRVRDELLAANSLLRQAGWLARLGVWTQ